MTDNPGGFGQAGPTDGGSFYNAMRFVVEQAIANVSTNKLVKVVAVYDADMNPVAPEDTGVVGPTGYVDVRPLVNMLDGEGRATEHGVIHGVPFTRGQGGGNAIICDPKVGDVGMMNCADRDISSVKVNRGEISNPGSNRKYSPADGVYCGPTVNGTPDQYLRYTKDGFELVDQTGNRIEFTPKGVKLSDAFGNVIDTTEDGVTFIDVSGSKLEMKGGDVEMTTGTFKLNGGLQVTGSAVINGEVTGGASGVGLTTHTHAQDPDSHGDTEQETEPPTPGT